MSNFASGYIKYINHLEQINDAALLNPQVMIDEVEDSYHEHIENIARNIVTHYKTAKVCMLAGPSSSGKTTTAHLLQRELGKLGVHAEIVSLDDFYLGPDETPVLPNGEKDYETVDALDIALIRDCLNSVIHSGSCLLPEYDFTTKARTLAARKLDVSDRGFVIMEGLHALNPIFTRDLPEGSTIKLYVSVKQQIKDINGTVLLTPEEIRDALDSGTLDEESIDPACLTGENGLLQWLWELFFGKDEEETPQYSGWRTENGKTYYYDQNTHQPVTGIQSIDNKLYYFDASGVQQPATFGIDVSKYQSSIDWDKVKTAGVEFAIIRIGYRGYGSGALVQDPKFEEHFTNARNAGLRVGIYCFSQAVNENEAREEAQACVYVLNGRQLDYPIYFDTEASGAGNGRADGLGVEDRTKCAVAFCEEVKALGYKPGVYASTTWFRKRLDMSQLSNYYIWNAHYNVASSPIACNMWQGTCTARIPGYGGQIDVNISYMG